jgi:hypothetical protein
MVVEEANILAVAPATCMPLCGTGLSHFTMVCVVSVLYGNTVSALRITQQDEFLTRLPKAHHTARIVARTERTY